WSGQGDKNTGCQQKRMQPLWQRLLKPDNNRTYSTKQADPQSLAGNPHNHIHNNMPIELIIPIAMIAYWLGAKDKSIARWIHTRKRSNSYIERQNCRISR